MDMIEEARLEQEFMNAEKIGRAFSGTSRRYGWMDGLESALNDTWEPI